jgi:hypothetical protein
MPKTIVHEYNGTISLEYDGEGTRVKKAISGGSTTYYIGNHFEVAGGVETKYIFGTMVGQWGRPFYLYIYIKYVKNMGCRSVLSACRRS